MLNRPNLRILPTFRTGYPTHDLHQKNDNSGPHKIFNRKKMLNRFYFPPTSRIPPTFVCGAGPDIQLRTSIKKNDNSGRHKIFKRKKMTGEPTHDLHQRTTTLAVTKYSTEKDVKSIIFPTYPPHSTHIRLWPGRISNLDLYQKERQLRPSQNIQKKKDVKSIIFPTKPFRIPPTFVCGAGPDIQLHRTSIKRQLRPSQNIQKKKDVKSIIFPNQTFRILPTFICGAGPENQHMTSITKNDNSGRHKIFNRKKMLNRFYFPPTLPHSTHIRCGAGPDIQLRTSIKKNDNSGRHKIFKRKKMLNRLYFLTKPSAFYPRSFVAQDRRTNT
ncbi:hypothetical protein TNCV_837291 [Trichonephila clavipes]|nr:hypothetical protein TNCV_837291 [Trichonephila clavipes]